MTNGIFNTAFHSGLANGMSMNRQTGNQPRFSDPSAPPGLPALLDRQRSSATFKSTTDDSQEKPADDDQEPAESDDGNDDGDD